MTIAVFGGTFNPIHFGHLRAAEEARELFGFDKVLFVPSGRPPLKIEELAGPAERCEMTRLAVAGNPFFEVSDIECTAPGKSYTVNTLEKVREFYDDARIYFVLGIDAFLDLPNWWQPERLLSLTDMVVVSRPRSRFSDLLSSPYLDAGREHLAALDKGESKSFPAHLKSGREALLVNITSMDISSTGIRRRVREGESIKYLLPEAVESFIIFNELYTTKWEMKNKKEAREEA